MKTSHITSVLALVSTTLACVPARNKSDVSEYSGAQLPAADAYELQIGSAEPLSQEVNKVSAFQLNGNRTIAVQMKLFGNRPGSHHVCLAYESFTGVLNLSCKVARLEPANSDVNNAVRVTFESVPVTERGHFAFTSLSEGELVGTPLATVTEGGYLPQCPPDRADGCVYNAQLVRLSEARRQRLPQTQGTVLSGVNLLQDDTRPDCAENVVLSQVVRPRTFSRSHSQIWVANGQSGLRCSTRAP